MRRGALFVLLLALIMAGSACLAWRAVGWWIDSSDQPVKSDILVVLAGDYEHPTFAAELFKQGFAPDVWISRPRRDPALVTLDGLGVRLPTEESVNRRILVARGVPGARIRLYGRDVNSTADEARALAGEYPFAGKKILVVTSRYHVRRARMIFSRLLPGAEVRVAAEPYDASTLKWWNDRDMTRNATQEIFKTIYFLWRRR